MISPNESNALSDGNIKEVVETETGINDSKNAPTTVGTIKERHIVEPPEVVNYSASAKYHFIFGRNASFSQRNTRDGKTRDVLE